MAITARTRKILWARSGNECAKCQANLVAVDGLGKGRPAVLGEECHIVARARRGPRGVDGPLDGVDDYANLILLCPNCHSTVDSRPDLFPSGKLLRIKSEHESRVASRSLPPQPLRMVYEDRLSDLKFHHMATGDMLMGVLASSLSYNHGHPPDLSSSQRALLGDFFQAASEWMDCHDIMGPKGYFEAADDLQGYIDGLREEELVVYATHRRMKVTGGQGPPSDWCHLAIYVMHESDVTSPANEPVAQAA
jgi:hypothetical protein